MLDAGFLQPAGFDEVVELLERFLGDPFVVLLIFPAFPSIICAVLEEIRHRPLVSQCKCTPSAPHSEYTFCPRNGDSLAFSP